MAHAAAMAVVRVLLCLYNSQATTRVSAVAALNSGMEPQLYSAYNLLWLTLNLCGVCCGS
jgi:hypothetical protein